MVEIVNLRRARKARAKADLALSGHKLEMPGGVGAVRSDNVGTSNQKEDNK